jgi:hypothetical protein
MLYDVERGGIRLALCGDLMPARPLAPCREPEFFALREILRGADASFETTFVADKNSFRGA